ncbi:TetR/AcrR family transcriptional regulator [Chloroflexota bacterium]
MGDEQVDPANFGGTPSPIVNTFAVLGWLRFTLIKGVVSMKKTFTREDIVEATFQVVRKQGRKKLSARTIAKELNSSTMPIYSTINSMQELEKEVGQKFTELLLQYCLTPWTGNFLVDMSFGYVRFAKDEKELFRIMFLDDEPSELADYETQKPVIFTTLTARLKEEPDFQYLDEEQIHHITQNMEIIIHGMACLINFGRLPDDSDEYIQQYLEEVSAFFVQQEEAQNSLAKDKGEKEMSKNFADTKQYPFKSMRTWARQIDSYEEIPPVFRSAFPKYTGSFPYTLFIPEGKYTLFLQGNKKIMCIYDGQIVLLEFEHNKVEKFTSPISEVLYLERGKILLNSWLTVQTLSGPISVKFNTTNGSLFEPVIEEIRRGMGKLRAIDAALGEDEQELSKFNFLSLVNYKFMNYGRKSIRPGDTVVGMAYQPECCIQEYALFNKTLFRRHTTSHLTLLTEKELILIKEKKRIKTDKEKVYGGVFTHIPRHRIQNISFIANPENTQSTMEITLPDNLRFRSEFTLDNEELQTFQQKCEDIGG